jgi:hypothetical protein
VHQHEGARSDRSAAFPPEQLLRPEVRRLRWQAESVEERQHAVHGVAAARYHRLVDPDPAGRLAPLPPGRADPPVGQGEAGDRPGLVVAHEVEDRVGREAVEGGEEAGEPAQGRARERALPPGAQADGDPLVEVRMPGEHRRHRLFHHPADPRRGESADAGP